MFEVVIRMPGKPEETRRLVPGVYRIGSSPASHLQLDRPEVSARHAQLIVSDFDVKVADCGSSNGTFLDEAAVGAEPRPAGNGSVVRIGEAELLVVGAAPPPAPAPPPSAGPSPARRAETTSRIQKAFAVAMAKARQGEAIPVLEVSGVPEAHRPLVQEIKRHAHVELLKRLNLKRLLLSGISEEDLAERAKGTIHDILSELSVPLPESVSPEVIEGELVHEAIGLGPLEDLIGMDDITEIMVNGPNQVYVEREGLLLRTDTAFADDNQVVAAIERIVSPLGRRIDESSPYVDARLKDGSRVNAIIPPLSLTGPCITIRKFSRTPLAAADLVRFSSISPEMVKFLEVCVRIRKNIVISGGTGSGKTTLLNVVSSFLPANERIITIEDAAELQLHQPHVIRLEARPPNIEGKGQIAIRDLVRNSLRMRPDRIVVGECRGGEALDMLQAMNTGHDGSLTTIHANSPRDCLSRLETLVLMAGFDLPLRAIREQVASAITIVVQLDRMKDGTRKVTSISEITKMEGEVISMQELFTFRHEGWTPEGRIRGRHIACGSIPTFMEEIQRARLDLDIAMFRDGREGVR